MFDKIELLIKSKGKDTIGTTNHTFENCEMVFSGDFIILIVGDEKIKTAKVFNLNEIFAYKTYNK